MRYRQTQLFLSTLITAIVLWAVFSLVSATDLCAERGIITYEGGAVYEGELNKEGLSGNGTLNWPNGATYTGEFRDGKFNGEGAYTFPSGVRYVGGFKDGKFHGRGILHYNNGVIYDGEFLNDKRHGYGTLIWPGDRKHQGKLQGDGSKAHGANVLPIGKTYAGEFRHGRKHGQGTLTEANGTEYIGEFRNGRKNGQGTTVYADGRMHTGEYRNDKWNGFGTLTWPNGDTYTGEFRDNKRHGIGVYTWAGGSKRTGRYENGKFVEVVKADASQPTAHTDKQAPTNSPAEDTRTTPNAGDFPVHFNISGREYSKIPPREGFLGRYLHKGGTYSGINLPDRYVVFNDNGEGIFESPAVTRKTEWGVEIEEGQPKVFSARNKRLQMGNAYRIIWKCLTRCDTAQEKHQTIMVDTHQPKALMGESVFTKIDE